MRHQRTIQAVLLAILVITSLFPTYAFAGPITKAVVSLGNDALVEVLRVVLSLLKIVHKILVQIISWGGTIINKIASQSDLNYGGAAVYYVWKIFRDMCNGLFIILFILVAFGTIFNVVWPNPFYYQTALKNVIIAAILINFSLPIGQTIIWGGNQASALVSGLMVGVDIGKTVSTKTQLPQVVVGNNGLAIAAVPQEGVPAAQQNAAQLIATNTFRGNAKTLFENCLKNGQAPIPECSAAALRVQSTEASAAVDKEIARLTAPRSLWSHLVDAGQYYGNAAKGAWKGGTSLGALAGGPIGMSIGAAKGAWSGARIGKQPAEPAKQSAQELALAIVSQAVNNFFLAVLALSFCVVILFMLVRFPMIWFYLAFSSLAFFSYGIPGTKALKEWFGNIFGWSIFAPLYLFVIYVGMFLLDQQGALLVGMKDSSFFAGVAGFALLYGMVGMTFIGGAAAAWKYAFSFSTSLQTAVTTATDKMGVGEKSKFGLSTIAKRTGMTARYEGAAAGIKSRYDKYFTKPQLRREEDIKAKWQSRFGDPKAGEALQRKRISEQMAKNKELGLSNADLKESLKKEGTDEYFAAARELLDRGELPLDQMSAYVAASYRISPAAGRAAQEAVNKKLGEKSKDKGFKSTAEALQAFKATDPDAQEKFLRDLKKNQLLEYASLASNPDTRALIMQLEGSSSPVLPADILRQNLSKIDADSIGKVMAAAKSGGWAVDDELNYRFDDLASEKGNHFKLIDGAKGPARTEAVNRLKKLKDDQMKADIDKARSIAEAGAEANAEAAVTAAERLEATREDRGRSIASRRTP